MIRPQGPRANVPLEVLEEPDEAMVGEALGHAADCWPIFPGTAVPWTAKIPVGVGGQFGGFGLWPSLAAGFGINPGWINQGPSAVPRELTAQETPLGPFELATNAPFPSLPCSEI